MKSDTNKMLCSMGKDPDKSGKLMAASLEKKISEQQGVSSATLSALRSGSHDAYREVYLHHIDSVLDFLKALTKSDDEAEEIAQEVFISLWEKRDKIDPTRNIQGYIYTYARNAVLNWLKRKKVEDKYIEFAANAAHDYVTSDELVIASETELLIRIAVERMPAQRKAIFKMSRFEGLSNDEIAARLNISKNTVENHITTGIKDIRRILGIFIFFMV